MEQSAQKVVGPMFELIDKLQYAKSPEEEKIMIRKLRDMRSEISEKLHSFDEEFERLRKSNLELEEKIKSLNEELDRKKAELSEGDQALKCIDCKNFYGDSWEKFDELSKEYLIMAAYLYELFNKDAKKDFSPSVLEFGRAVENELVRKIYRGYVASLSSRTSHLTDNGRLYGNLTHAVEDYKTKNGEYFIPARVMVRYLRYLSDEEIVNAYNENFKKYLEFMGIDRVPISQEGFISKADELFDRYRNTAAHPGNTIGKEDAAECRKKSRTVLKTFMSAVQ